MVSAGIQTQATAPIIIDQTRTTSGPAYFGTGNPLVDDLYTRPA